MAKKIQAMPRTITESDTFRNTDEDTMGVELERWQDSEGPLRLWYDAEYDEIFVQYKFEQNDRWWITLPSTADGYEMEVFK